MTVAEYLSNYEALRSKYPESLEIQMIVTMLNVLVIQGLADRSCTQFHDQFWIDYPEIPSATEAAERSPEPAQTTPAKDSG